MNSHKSTSKILIVDDNPSCLKVLVHVLKKQGYKTSIALNGDEAVKNISTTNPDIILMDIEMPVFDGYEACTLLKNNPETSDIPIIFVSSLSSAVDRLRAYRAGGVDFIEKPFYSNEVVTKIQTHFSRSISNTLENSKAKEAPFKLKLSIGRSRYQQAG